MLIDDIYNLISFSISFLFSIFVFLPFAKYMIVATWDGMSFESNEDYVSAELLDHRRKLREMNYILKQQHHLLRLISRKMDIRTEADDMDEGVPAHEFRLQMAANNAFYTSRWTSPRIRTKLRAAISFSKSI